jgi:hypothetical protein
MGELFFHPIGNLFWNAEISEQLRDLHLQAIAALRPITNGLLMSQFVDRLSHPNSDLSEKQKAMVHVHGFFLFHAQTNHD